jgi:hypothetical protein
MALNPTAAIADFEERVTDQIRQVRLTVFVCGPAERDAAGALSAEPGATVRRYVSERIRENGHHYVWGEHLLCKGGGIETAWIRRFDNADKEVMFALHSNTDLVVIFPSSSGSLAELGAFCMHDKISPKLLVLFDSRYKGDEGFVITALSKAAKSRKATIRFVDYGHPKQAWHVVRKIIGEQRMLKTVRLTHG